MRYTPEQTLLDAADTLEAHVVPHVPPGQPAVALGQVVAALRRLAREWDAALPFLTGQNDELRALLGEAPAGPVLELGAAFAENVRLNRALAERITAAGADDAIRAHLARWTACERELTGTDTTEMLPF